MLADLCSGGIEVSKGFVKIISGILIVIMLIGAASTVALGAEYYVTDAQPSENGIAPELNAQDGTPVMATIPARFNYDPSDLPPYITSVKNQGNMGLCWAFAAVSCAEADALKNEGEDVPKNLDLSEWHLAYFTYNGTRSGTGDTVSVDSSVKYYDLGGYSDTIAMVLSNKIGFVSESVAPMSTLERYPGRQLSSSLMYRCEYQLENAYCYDPSRFVNIYHGAPCLKIYSVKIIVLRGACRPMNQI